MKNIFLAILLCVILFTGCGKEDEFVLENDDLKVSAEKGPEKEQTEENEAEKAEEPGQQKEAEKIFVDVCGAVKNPGVYELLAESRVWDCIDAAGGFLEDADQSYLNRAAKVSDGMQIRVYTKEETSQMAPGNSASGPVSDGNAKEEGKININTASVDELQKIPGIGLVRAQAILDYREANGSFSTIEDIQNVTGIKGKTYEKIESYITT